MNRERLGIVLPLIAGMMFLVLAFSRTQGRTVWLALAAASVLLGIARRRRRRPGA